MGEYGLDERELDIVAVLSCSQFVRGGAFVHIALNTQTSPGNEAFTLSGGRAILNVPFGEYEVKGSAIRSSRRRGLPGCGDRLVAVEVPPEPSQELLVASVVVLDVAEELVVR